MLFQCHYENMNLLIVIYEHKFDLVVNVVCYLMFDNFAGVGFVVDLEGLFFLHSIFSYQPYPFKGVHIRL